MKAAADAKGISGNGLTKYLMKAVDKITGGRLANADMAVMISTPVAGFFTHITGASNSPDGDSDDG